MLAIVFVLITINLSVLPLLGVPHFGGLGPPGLFTNRGNATGRNANV